MAAPADKGPTVRYVKPPLRIMREVLGDDAGRGTDAALDVYCSEQTLLRAFFWYRLWLLTRLLRRFASRGGACLDFGGGSGVFLASLRTGFERVSLIDIDTRHATALIDRLGLDGIEVVRQDVATYDFAPGSFDAIVAADVLEHFREPAVPLRKIRAWLADDGVLFTSLPTETLAYRLLRVVFRKTKPPDHYHSAREVENAIGEAGFRRIAGICHPLWIPVLPLFRISAWRKRGA